MNDKLGDDRLCYFISGSYIIVKPIPFLLNNSWNNRFNIVTNIIISSLPNSSYDVITRSKHLSQFESMDFIVVSLVYPNPILEPKKETLAIRNLKEMVHSFCIVVTMPAILIQTH